MEVQEAEARTRLRVRVANFWQQTSRSDHTFQCQKDVQIGAARAMLNVKLDLFADQENYRQLMKKNSRFHSQNYQAVDWTSPRSKQYGVPSKTSSLNSPDTKASKSVKQMNPTHMNYRNLSRSPASPRIKKSALQELYTKGGIEEIIYGDSKDTFSSNSPKTDWNREKDSQHLNQNNFLERCEVADADGDQLDVGILVECTRTNIPSALLRHLRMTSGIGERPEQQRELVFEDERSGVGCGGRWRGLLVPRVSVRSYDLLERGDLCAWLEITFSPQVLHSCQNSLVTLSRDLRVMLETHDSSADAALITTDGGKLPAHLVILRARSNLLGSCKILSHPNCDIALIVDGRSPTLVKPPALQPANLPKLETSAYDSFATDISAKFTPPSQRQNRIGGASGKGIINANSPKQHYRNLPRKSAASPVKKPPVAAKFSQKLTSSDRLALFSKQLEPIRTPLKGKENICLNSILDEESQLSDEEKSLKDLNQCFIECDDTRDSTITSTMDVLRTNEDEGSLSELKENFSQLHFETKSPSKEVQQKSLTPKDDRVLVQVNMSTSVARQFLEWLYTGECSDLATLARPLLLAGRRHGVPQLAAAAERHLAAQLDAHNAPELLLLAHTQQANHLLQRALELVRARAEEVTATQAWEDVISKCPKLGVMVTRTVLTKNTP